MKLSGNTNINEDFLLTVKGSCVEIRFTKDMSNEECLEKLARRIYPSDLRRYSVNGYNNDIPFKSECHLYVEDKETEKRKLVAILAIIFFNEGVLEENDDITDIGEELTYWADTADQDTYDAINALTHHKIFTQKIKKEIKEKFTPFFTLYIEHLYVMPKFRNRGYGSFLFEYLPQIVGMFTGAAIRAAVITPVPQKYIKGKWSTEDNNEEMQNKMIKLLEKYNYKLIAGMPGSDGDAPQYAQNFANSL